MGFTPSAGRGWSAQAGRPWLVAGDGGGIGAAVVQRLRAEGVEAEEVSVDPLDPAAARAALAGGRLTGVIALTGIDEAAGAATGALAEAAARGCGGVLHLAQALPEGCQFVISTRGAVAPRPGATVPDPVQAAVWGLGRVVATERPGARVRLVDLDPDGAVDAGAAALIEELTATDETELARRDGARFAPRLGPIAAPTTLPRPAGEFQLQPLKRGTLDDLALASVEPGEPGPGEVRLRVLATGLNFRDVLNALGMYPGDPGPLGGECVGVVEAVGEGVADLEIGQRVLGLAPGSFATTVVQKAALLAPAPTRWSDAQLASLPIVYLTAWHALVELGHIAAGQRVLIHAGAGGVGIAAIRIAQSAGAVVLSTAGSPRKRAFLRSLGVEHIYDSRSLDFAGQIAADFGPRPLDLVLNSLAGEAIPAALGLLREGGHFLEIGKTDLWEPERVAARFPGVLYSTIALDALSGREPERVGRMLAGLMARVATGELTPLPVRTWPLDAAPDAFRFMQQALHIGKLVLTQSESPARADGAYLVTGGSGALGLLAARWLAERGAGCVALLGRRPPREATLAEADAIAALGARVRFLTADVADGEALSTALAELRAAEPDHPLRGIVHAAGVLADAALERQSVAGLRRVLAPKLGGADHLARLTAGDPIEFFALYSSACGVLGGPGRAIDAGATAALDALAAGRVALGQPGLSVAWGAWAGGGMAAGVGGGRASFDGRGMRLIEPDEGMRTLEALLRGAEPRPGVLPVQWDALVASLPPGANPSLLRDVGGPVAAASGPVAALADLASLPASDREDRLLALVEDRARRVLGLPASVALDPGQALQELGLDSLMAVELRNGLSAMVGQSLPASLLFDHPTPRALARMLLVEVLELGDDEDAAGASAPSQDADEGLGDLSEAELEASLLRELEEAGF